MLERREPVASGDDVPGSADTSLHACSAWLILTPTPKTIEIPTTPLNDISTVTKSTRTNLHFLHPQLGLALKQRFKPIRESQSGRKEGLRGEVLLWHN